MEKALRFILVSMSLVACAAPKEIQVEKITVSLQSITKGERWMGTKWVPMYELLWRDDKSGTYNEYTLHTNDSIGAVKELLIRR